VSKSQQDRIKSEHNWQVSTLYSEARQNNQNCLNNEKIPKSSGLTQKFDILTDWYSRELDMIGSGKTKSDS
jgi:hypothetical protein